MADCSVLVCSCDKYEEAWAPFFALLKKYWSDCKFNLYLNTETKKCAIEGVSTINVNEKSWTRRLNAALSKIDSEYVIVMLEDFFIQKKVASEKIDNLIDIMKKNTDIAVFYLNRITGYRLQSEYAEYYKMIPSEENSRYMLNCQTALWRKEVLAKVTSSPYSPWEFEEIGYKNMAAELSKYRFYCSNTTYYDAIRDNDIFSYLLIRDLGYGIWQSKWLWNNKKLFKKEGIPFEPRQLPVMSKFEFLKNKCKDRLLRRFHGKK